MRLFFGTFVLFALCVWALPSDPIDISTCEVLIVGGTTASLSAALSSARMKVHTCLLEPTDWVAGQLTASGVSAIDFAWHTVTNSVTKQKEEVYKYARDEKNLAYDFMKIVKQIGSPGQCWVSTNCFPPLTFLHTLSPFLSEVSEYLSIYYNTVPKRVETKINQQNNNKIITVVEAIQRISVTGKTGWERLLHQDLSDWYSPNDSIFFTKKNFRFLPPPDAQTWPVMDATEWGEILALSGAPYLQGTSEKFDGDVSGEGNDQCGQAITFGLAEDLHAQDTPEPSNPYPVPEPLFYNYSGYTFQQIWTYRRLVGKTSTPAAGDVCYQNWGKGNDDEYIYLLSSRAETTKQVSENRWIGGVDIERMEHAEYLAFGWHWYFKDHMPIEYKNKITLDKSIFGTGHGLTKVPYMRDTRRSIGLDNFIMRVSDISAYPSGLNLTAFIFPDRVAIGCYDVDIHKSPMSCVLPAYMLQYYPVLPYFIPFRALTNRDISNLLMSGKTIAQSFLTNSATRLHPVEWSAGIASGVAAAYMVQNQLTSTTEVYRSHIKLLQTAIEKFAPTRWTIEGHVYPPL
eukprot:TRINITY_DN3900_c0_g1_i1.p1 TRINITY_DN3900_c0_g1~~TRINITY_DN3900_c0_g1_i1.p1  ORF type:complete len:570 (-),score=103.21 TRINITY_DN3900_c0_g1_i1:113-1822(-)